MPPREVHVARSETLAEALPDWVPTELKQPATELVPHIVN